MNNENTVTLIFPEKSPETDAALNAFAAFLAEMIAIYGDKVLGTETLSPQ